MRITLETTVYETEYALKVTLEKPVDDLELSKMFELFADALEGMGYAGARKWLEGDDGGSVD